ncbi:hypothetical protein Vch1786_I1776 [Vibrio cholerae O1 str. 2010EL-1786]|uniref:Uncharacterized protein n=2 Tax=Vibrio cholerae TaxID=666 RepID=Q9KPS8_VIBCH|nr:hypothetical protein VC_2284 [Vibrio cholerae O1 biovar El Tor str. N16961]ACP06508.1 conserved hypothetical protein [Vibrio cholerae M66-2]ACP10390.1 conserved hypothetical protein [Vibrio cholerae O395]AET27368.1 hypothetical protein Vch1786_I1776 [Vibrio cholerae O1 str. 2010EL-1786]EEO02885.1 hypothetical protein VCA_001873 [Vibrio cholerae VL426]EEO06662.1 hypothetical protein VIF_001652 [Vibrio cholerae TM 11079-80]EEO08962.1 hypothetical protein VCC_003328 [Vibrio cholerae RC9]EEO1
MTQSATESFAEKSPNHFTFIDSNQISNDVSFKI